MRANKWGTEGEKNRRNGITPHGPAHASAPRPLSRPWVPCSSFPSRPPALLDHRMYGMLLSSLYVGMDEAMNEAVLSFIFHELRNPSHDLGLLNEKLRDTMSSHKRLFERIGGAIQDQSLLKEIEANHAEFETCLDALVRTNHQLAAVLNDLMWFQRPTHSADLSVSQAEIPVGALVAEFTALLAKEHMEYEVTNHSSRHTIIADKQRIVQAVSKLVSNALKCAGDKIHIDLYTESGAAHHTSTGSGSGSGTGTSTSTSTSTSTGGVLCIVVKDEGPAIPANTAKAMFDAFKSISHHGEEKTYAAGLGLPIAQNICRAHKGKCSYERKVGQNCFKATFTLGTAASHPATPPPESSGTTNARGSLDAPPPESPTQPTTCVIVDDSAVARKMMAGRMRALGVSVTNEFRNGVGVAQYCTANPPSFVVLDREMPEQCGLKTAVELREAKYAGPIIAVTGSTTDNEVEEFKAFGANVVIPKPASALDVLDAFMRLSHH